MPRSLPALVDLQRRCNRASAGSWAPFAAHRARLTDLVRGAGADGGRLAVLGAGNGNDLDLAALGERFTEVHLFDLDAEALARARRRHRGGAVVVRPPIDLSGTLPLLPGLRQRPPTDQEIARLPGAAVEAVLAAIPERFEAVVSACLLSQILHGAHVALGPGHHRLTAVSCALVIAHARLLVRLLEPGGTGLLVTDVVSSEGTSLEEALAEPVTAEGLAQLEAAHRCAAGTGPRFLERVLAADREAGPSIEALSLVDPWRWRWRESRSYLVHALRFKVRGLPG